MLRKIFKIFPRGSFDTRQSETDGVRNYIEMRLDRDRAGGDEQWFAGGYHQDYDGKDIWYVRKNI